MTDNAVVGERALHATAPGIDATVQPAPAFKPIPRSAARLGIRGAAFYLAQRPHLPPLPTKVLFVRNRPSSPCPCPCRYPNYRVHVYHATRRTLNDFTSRSYRGYRAEDN
ncbi:hypothetical protein K0M31_005904, partial [Melipona bicolor]